jgi:hypothetical protein
MSETRWVERNEDKPHRCPECHAVATWGRGEYGPRTRLVCPRDCGVQWRVGNRETLRINRRLARYAQQERIGLR